ncbi:non-ribosomal peptide synthetase [Streptomyces sp. NBC_01304]|uniref:non-ribosomal peptide synthetase n=1 Tax=Streptomyces sp. NBC_01304 TaxID=2903818 RepID=UPI002E0D1EC4|nr:non-ribosomal peptide synthetase [Streptomyces sp. NBC_01304]
MTTGLISDARRAPASLPPSHPLASSIAAALVVLHRRQGHDEVSLFCTVAQPANDADGFRGTVSVDFGADPTFADLVDLTARQLAGPAGPGDEGAVRFVYGDGDASETSPALRASTNTAGLVTFTVDDGVPVPAGQLAAALDSGTSDRTRPVSHLTLLGPGELAELTALNGSGQAAEPARCLHELVADQAAQRPAAIAVDCGDVSLTYRELVDRSTALARALRTAGVTTDSVVGVLHHRSPELIVSLLAVLRAGGAYLALDPDDPVARHRQLLDTVGVQVVLAGADLADLAAGHGRTVVIPETEGTDSSEPVSSDEPVAVTPLNLAYVSFTSGSTGEPKGVGVPHRAVARLLRGADWVDIGPDDVFLELAPVAFDASTIEVWGPLLNGGRVVIHPGGTVELDELAKTVVDHQVTVLLLTTGLFNQMVTEHLGAFAGVRHVLTGGDTASPAHVRRLLDAYPALRFTNGYGPTENTSYTTCWTSRDLPGEGPVPIGPPISGTRIAILDAGLAPVPVGVVGELYASGDGLARGYAARPGATAERFVADPYAPEPGSRMYRTGDLVRRLPDGSVEFIGRVDQQVKVRGFRVELGHVEAALKRRAGVREAVVVAQQDAVGNKRLLAYAVAEDAFFDDLDGFGRQVLAELRSELPSYMVPWALLCRRELPLNKNGKVDRKALPAVHRAVRTLPTDYSAPATATEQLLADAWGEILDVEPVGVHDNFFDLGGHSLLAAGLIARIQRDFGVELNARTLYTKPTVAGLAEEIGGQAVSGAS